MKELLNKANRKQILIFAAILLVLAAGSCKLYYNLTAKPQTVNYIATVRTLTIGKINSDEDNIYPGEVRGRYESQLSFQTSGKINSRLVNVGDRVHTGQVLMTLDPKDIKQNVEAADAQLTAAIANQKLASDNASRYNKLYTNGAVSEAVRDQYNTQLEAADASLRQAYANVNANNNMLEYTHLISDADGVIAAINGEVGQVAAAGTPMITLIQNGEREIQINVPENVSLKQGDDAKITFWALPDIKLNGSIREISPIADSLTKTYKVQVSVPQLPSSIKLGMTAKVFFPKHYSESKADEFIIPATALYQLNEKTQVWLVRDGKAVLQDVKTAGYIGNNVRITKGLSKGDKLITAGLNKLVENQTVRLAEGGEN